MLLAMRHYFKIKRAMRTTPLGIEFYEIPYLLAITAGLAMKLSQHVLRERTTLVLATEL